MASVTVRQLTKVFDAATPALRDLSLEVRDGEFLVLLGSSGSGKTTVLRCIAGLEEPTAGEIYIGDRVVTHLAPGERDVAMVFQNYALYPHLDVRANIAFALEMRGMSRRDIAGRVTAVAERFGLAELLKRKPAELSGGQRQRVALARTIVRQPKVFLLDEPLSNLDARVRMEMRADLLELHETLGSTMIYVTHDQVEAMTLGQRMAILHEGRLRQVGTPADVYERPADIFVARFVGNPGMNVLTGTAAALEDGVLHCGSLRVPVASHHYTAEGHIGIRPEHVTLGALNRGIGNALVRVVEPLGSETLVHLDAGGQPLVARVRGLGKLKTGDRVGVRLADEHLHVFDVHGDRIG